MSRSRVKTIITVFLTAVTLCANNLYLGQTVNHVFYKEDWVLQHNNELPHNALSIREFLVKKSIPVLTDPTAQI